ncbi:conserved hypothetical protein [Ricinus communis]|uniref:Uncharacterized protein n=2 Tax=Ricinus communis TaxID=3988 RepID=B9RZV9_RICCO|nr:conserved hypothetical protein [Ricinus communis]
MPRLIERIQAANNTTTAAAATTTTSTAAPTTTTTAEAPNHHLMATDEMGSGQWAAMAGGGMIRNDFGVAHVTPSYTTPETSSTAASSDSFGTQVSPVSDMTNNNDHYSISVNHNANPDTNYFQSGQVCYSESMISPSGYFNQGLDFQAMEQNNINQLWADGGDTTDNLWSVDDIWFNM